MRNKQLQDILIEISNSIDKVLGCTVKGAIIPELEALLAPIDDQLPFTMPAKYAIGDKVQTVETLGSSTLPSEILAVRLWEDSEWSYAVYDSELDKSLWYWERELEPVDLSTN